MLTVISISTKIKLSIEDFNAMYNKIAENEKGSIFFGVGFNKDYKNNIYHVVVNKELSKSDIEDIKNAVRKTAKQRFVMCRRKIQRIYLNFLIVKVYKRDKNRRATYKNKFQVMNLR